MEVHHHPHVEKKNFKEYFLEFLMIFLAVTMGFFAESLREHIGERTKEKEYMKSLVEELKYDTAQYSQVLNNIQLLKPILDSLYKNAKDPARFNYTLQGKWNGAMNAITLEYKPDLPTIEQLKSSGNVRLIENSKVANKVMEYDALVKGRLEEINRNIYNAAHKVYGFEDELCDYANFVTVELASDEYDLANKSVYHKYDMAFIVKDPVRLNEMANSFVNYKFVGTVYKRTSERTKKIATELIKSINEEYHFEK